MGRARHQFWDFVETIENAHSVDEVGDAFLAETARLGYAYAGLGVSDYAGELKRDELMFARAREEWLSHYLEENYVAIDPMVREAQRRVTPFMMSDLALCDDASPRQIQLFHERQEALGRDGLVAPVAANDSSMALGLLFTGGEVLDPGTHAQAVAVTTFAHATTQRLLRAEVECAAAPPRLTPRERECLMLAARGKSDWMIGEILNLSERTVHHAVERAKRRYGVATRVQAVVRAIHSGEILTSEVVD